MFDFPREVWIRKCISCKPITIIITERGRVCCSRNLNNLTACLRIYSRNQDEPYNFYNGKQCWNTYCSKNIHNFSSYFAWHSFHTNQRNHDQVKNRTFFVFRRNGNGKIVSEKFPYLLNFSGSIS